MYKTTLERQEAELRAAKQLRTAKVATVIFLIGCLISGLATFGLTSLI